MVFLVDCEPVPGSQSTKNTIERWKNKQNYTVETGSQSTRNTIERWKNKQNYTVGTVFPFVVIDNTT
jgi:ribosomal protein S30